MQLQGDLLSDAPNKQAVNAESLPDAFAATVEVEARKSTGWVYRDPQLWEDGAWTDGDLVFANSTCFARELMEGLGERCALLKPGAVVVTLTQPLEFCPHPELFHTRMLSMSWGAATAFFHRRRA